MKMDEPSESEIRTAKEIGVTPEQFHAWMDIHMKNMHDVVKEVLAKNRKKRVEYRAYYDE
jgi:hypothetical protein